MTPRDGTRTRERILDAAEALILERGLAGTPIDAILSAAATSKGTFFHHFKTKDDLAAALLERFADRERALLDQALARARGLSRDPLQQLLLLVGIVKEYMEQLASPAAGCLFASYCYEVALVPEASMELAGDSMRRWRDAMVELMEAAAAVHPPAADIDFQVLADQFNVIVEGAFVFTRLYHDPAVASRQLDLYRRTLELVFGQH